MGINEALLTHTLDIVTKLEGPGETWLSGWRQQDWRCETGMCFAGWVVELAGREWVTDDWSQAGCAWLVATEEEVKGGKSFAAQPYCTGLPTTIQVTTVDHAAINLLGIGSQDGTRLFHQDNDLADLTQMVHELLTEGCVSSVGHEDEPEEDDDGDYEQRDRNVCPDNADGYHGPLIAEVDWEIADTHVAVLCRACGTSTGYPIAEFAERLDWN